MKKIDLKSIIETEVNPIARIGFAVGVLPIVAQVERYKSKKNRNKTIPEKVKETKASELVFSKEDYVRKMKLSNVNEIKIKKESLFEEDRNFAESLLSQLVEKGIETSSYTGLLTCNVDISSLAKSADGAYRGFCIGQDGRILEQAKFSEISVPTPMLAFQLTSIVTGQYYQHMLTKRLESMDSKLNKIVNILESKFKSDINNACKQFKKYWELSSYDEPQKAEILRLVGEMNKGREQMWELIIGITPSVKRGFSDKAEAKNWMTFLKDSSFTLYMEYACYYEKLYFIGNLLEMKAYKDNEEVVQQCYNEIFEQKNDWQKYSGKYHEIKVILTENIKELSQDCWIGKDSIEAYEESLLKEFESIEKLYKTTQEEMIIPVLIQLEFSKNELIGKYLISSNNV